MPGCEHPAASARLPIVPATNYLRTPSPPSREKFKPREPPVADTDRLALTRVEKNLEFRPFPEA
ncbi:MAG: hypothetical protein RIS70_411 [Planctomycetota bacterium]